jgi:hypothetical protein
MRRFAVTLTALLLGLSSGSLVRAGGDPPASDEQSKIIGSWTFTGTLQEKPNDPIPLFGMVSFNPGGTLVENDADTAPSPGFRNTPALGSWTQIDENTYAFRARTFVFSDQEVVVAVGTGTGTVRFKGNSRDRFTGSGTYEIVGVDGTVLVGNGEFTQKGTRFPAR